MLKLVAVSATVAVALLVGLSSTPVLARVGVQCGSFLGISCGPEEFCQKPTGKCVLPDFGGRCVRVPMLCPKIFRPVCGCNGRTYANDCERMVARVDKLHDGRCR